MRIQSKEVVLGKVADLFSSQDYDEQELYNLFLLLVKDPTLNHNDHETIKVLSFIADSFKNIQRRVEAVTISSLWAKPNSFFEVKFIPKWDENVCMLNDVEERLRIIKDVLLKTHSNTALESRAVAMWS